MTDKGGYVIEASEIVRVYSDRVTVDVAGKVAAKEQTQSDATADAMDATAMLAARLEAAERLLAERKQTIDDLRRRLDNEAEERRKLTARLVDHLKRYLTLLSSQPRLKGSAHDRDHQGLRGDADVQEGSVQPLD
jgi:chromosome segregation ATPase